MADAKDEIRSLVEQRLREINQYSPEEQEVIRQAAKRYSVGGPPPAEGSGFVNKAKSFGQGILDSLLGAAKEAPFVQGPTGSHLPAMSEPERRGQGMTDTWGDAPVDMLSDIRPLLNLFKEDPSRAAGQLTPVIASLFGGNRQITPRPSTPGVIPAVAKGAAGGALDAVREIPVVGKLLKVPEGLVQGGRQAYYEATHPVLGPEFPRGGLPHKVIQSPSFPVTPEIDWASFAKSREGQIANDLAKRAEGGAGYVDPFGGSPPVRDVPAFSGSPSPPPGVVPTRAPSQSMPSSESPSPIRVNIEDTSPSQVDIAELLNLTKSQAPSETSLAKASEWDAGRRAAVDKLSGYIREKGLDPEALDAAFKRGEDLRWLAKEAGHERYAKRRFSADTWAELMKVFGVGGGQ